MIQAHYFLSKIAFGLWGPLNCVKTITSFLVLSYGPREFNHAKVVLLCCFFSKRICANVKYAHVRYVNPTFMSHRKIQRL